MDLLYVSGHIQTTAKVKEVVQYGLLAAMEDLQRVSEIMGT
jgi:hypothetical protein